MQPSSEKSTGQKATDTVSGNSNENSQSMLDKGELPSHSTLFPFAHVSNLVIVAHYYLPRNSPPPPLPLAPTAKNAVGMGDNKKST